MCEALLCICNSSIIIILCVLYDALTEDYKYYLIAECTFCVHYYDAHADLCETWLIRIGQWKLVPSNTCMCSETPVVGDHHQVNYLLLHILGK